MVFTKSFLSTIIPVVCALKVLGNDNIKVTPSKWDISVAINQAETIGLSTQGLPADEQIKLQLWAQHEGLIKVDPTSVTFEKNDQVYKVEITGLYPGHLELTSNYTAKDGQTVDSVFVRITVLVSDVIARVSDVVGWVYFAAWSIAFYPQIWINFHKKSVVGFSTDFATLNFMGYLMYTLFNAGLYWIPAIQREYSERHPRGLIPVLINDVCYGIHAIFATLVLIIQCLVYGGGNLRLSCVAKTILGVFTAVVVVFFVLVFTETWKWLDFLYGCSYIKLIITLIKYIPQALMNYRRKSTSGWSIGYILLALTGGVSSILQMILNAYNYADWNSLLGSPTKLGIGLFTIFFDILFILQHYVIYRDEKETKVRSRDSVVGMMWLSGRNPAMDM